jgi:hypothetical protein
MGALDLFFHTKWQDMTSLQKVILSVALVMFFLIGTLTILTLGHGVLQWLWGDHVQENVVSHSPDNIVYVGASHYVDEELLQSPNQTLTLAHVPNPASSLQLVGWGLHLSNGSENDYILSGNSITLLIKKEPWDQFHASYRY